MLFNNNLKEIEEKIGYFFKEEKLLDKALTHKSYSIEKKISYHNERLEFLGDSVIGVIVSEYLIKQNPEKDEGYLSKLKSYIVSSKNLYRWAKLLELDKYIKVSKVKELLSGKARNQILANAFESIIGAMYLDGGFEEAKKLIYKIVSEDKYIITNDYKSYLQEYSQKNYKKLPDYKLISQSGPDHRKTFIVSLYINGNYISNGRGESIKEAQQDAARNAMEKLKI
jgi:ribonuclease-3